MSGVRNENALRLSNPVRERVADGQEQRQVMIAIDHQRGDIDSGYLVENWLAEPCPQP